MNLPWWLTNATSRGRAGAHRAWPVAAGGLIGVHFIDCLRIQVHWRQLAGARLACSRRAAGFDEVWTALQLKRVKAADVRKQIK